MENMVENMHINISNTLNTMLNTLILDPLNDTISSIELIRVSGSDIDVVNAARVSYGKVSTEISDRDRKLISFLLEHNHTSPFEHNQLSFRIKAPIFVVRQWMRHRMNSYNEISYRYVKSALEFYIPPKWRSCLLCYCWHGIFVSKNGCESYRTLSSCIGADSKGSKSM